MTGVTRWNKAKTLAGADGWNLTTDVGAALDTANVVVPVASSTERDGLTPPGGKYAGMVVARTDLPGVPLERYDGTNWYNKVHSEWSFSQTAIPSATTFGCGTLTNDAANTTDPGNSITSPSAATITLRDAGIYSIDVMGAWGTATTGRAFTQIFDGSTNIYARASAVVAEDKLSCSISNQRFGAGATLSFATFLTLASGSTTWVGRVRITKVV